MVDKKDIQKIQSNVFGYDYFYELPTIPDPVDGMTQKSTLWLRHNEFILSTTYYDKHGWVSGHSDGRFNEMTELSLWYKEALEFQHIVEWMVMKEQKRRKNDK